jgi:hypothetical protein
MEWSRGRVLVCDQRIEGEKIKSTQSDQTIDNTGKPAHAAKEKGNKVEVEKSDQSPVDCSDD